MGSSQKQQKQDDNKKIGRPNGITLPFLYKFKKIMQKLCTQTEILNMNNSGQVMEKEWAIISRKKHNKKKEKKKKKKQGNNNNNEQQQQYVLCRKRYHNFTKNVMAHEFLSYRRIDRFYHRATIRFYKDIENNYYVLQQQQQPKPPSNNSINKPNNNDSTNTTT